MCCNTKPSPAAACAYVEQVLGEVITQRDWHDMRALAKNIGLDSSRSKADPLEAQAVIGSFVLAVQSEASSQVDNSDVVARFVEGAPTKGTLSILSYMQNRGVKKTLDRVRISRKAEALGKKMYPEGTPAYVGKRREVVKHAEMFDGATLSNDGVVRWEANGSVPPEDVLEHWKRLEQIDSATYERSKRALNEQTMRVIDEYKKARLAMTDEEKAAENFELRAAFGPDHVVVDVITGETRNTGH